MTPLKIYVGMNNKFVLCEKFPDDKYHAGLHEMLEFLYDNDPFVCHQDESGNYTDETVEPGFYMAHFTIENTNSYSPEDEDAYLVIGRLEKVKND